MKFDPEMVRNLSFFANTDSSTEASGRRHTGWRVGEALRQIVDRLVDSKIPDDEFESLADEFDQTARRLSSFEYGRSYSANPATSATALSASGHTDYSPLSGRANPLAPPMTFWIDGDTLFSEATFGHAYEGPPGCVHGGILAAAFDEILGAAQAASGDPGMTGTLTVVYRAPSPLHAPIRFEATLDDVQGRKVMTSARSYVAGPSGDISADDRMLTAESHGIFISIDFEKLATDLAKKQDETSRGPDE